MISDKTAIILRLLLDHGEMYGLELIGKSNGLLKRGSIYVLLDRMEENKLVKSALERTPEGKQGPPRRVYRITGKGELAFEAKLAQQSAFHTFIAGESL